MKKRKRCAWSVSMNDMWPGRSLTSNPWIRIQARSRRKATQLQCIHEPPHIKTSKMAIAPNEDTDQPGHRPCLIGVFAVRMKKHWVLRYPLSALRRLWSGGFLLPWTQEFWSNLPQNIMQPFPNPSDATHKIWSRLANWPQRHSSSKV